MTRYDTAQLRAYLEAIDRHLDVHVELVVIGGSAALLQHGAHSATRDIDAFAGDVASVQVAARHAAAEIGYAVPIDSAAIADLPSHYDQRLEEPLPHLKKLRLRVPDRYDLILSKLLRASAGDLVVCREIHAHSPLDAHVLIKRYLDEMNHAIGRQADHDQNLVAAIEYLWNAERADAAEQQIQRARARQQ